MAYNSETFVASFSRANGDNIIGELDFNRGLNGNIKVQLLKKQTVEAFGEEGGTVKSLI